MRCHIDTFLDLQSENPPHRSSFFKRGFQGSKFFLLVSSVITDQIPKMGLYKKMFSVNKWQLLLWMHVQKCPKNNVVQTFFSVLVIIMLVHTTKKKIV